MPAGKMIMVHRSRKKRLVPKPDSQKKARNIDSSNIAPVVRKLIRRGIETKHVQGTFQVTPTVGEPGSTSTPTGQLIQLIPNLPQGDGGINRDGNKLIPVGCHLRYSLSNTDPAKRIAVRVIIFTSNDENVVTTTLPQNIYTYMRATQLDHIIKLHSDITYVTSAQNDNRKDKYVKKFIPLKYLKKLEYAGDSALLPSNRRLYCFFLVQQMPGTTGLATTMAIEVGTRFYFKDI